MPTSRFLSSQVAWSGCSQGNSGRMKIQWLPSTLQATNFKGEERRPRMNDASRSRFLTIQSCQDLSNGIVEGKNLRSAVETRGNGISNRAIDHLGNGRCTSIDKSGLDNHVGSGRRGMIAMAIVGISMLNNGVKADGLENARAYMNFSVDGDPIGRVVIEIDPKIAPVGAQRFLDLVKGIDGVGYRRTQVSMIQDTCIVDNGPRSLSFKASGSSPIAGGSSTELLEEEMLSTGRGVHDKAGVVSLVVKRATEREVKEKLVAIKGQLVAVSQAIGDLPNGAAFSITTKPDRSLDDTNLVVGRVIEGLDIVDALASLPRVKDNSSSPFFKAGKASGDGRARVAGTYHKYSPFVFQIHISIFF